MVKLYFSITKKIASLFEKRVQSGVLQLTLGIGLVIAAICSSMIMLVYFARLNFLQHSIQDKLRSNTNSGIQYLMASRESLKYASIRTIDMFYEEGDTVQLMRMPWGLFDLFFVKAKQGKHEFAKAALVTAQSDSISDACIYIPQGNALTYLSGKASIHGDAYLPEQGLTAGIINGKIFSDDRLIHGRIKKSGSMPTLDTVLLNALNEIFSKRATVYKLNQLEFKNLRGTYSFKDSAANYYFNEGVIELTDTLSGNLIIQSDYKIVISAEAILKDVLLIAPDIEIQQGFKGSIQCFASRYISVGKDCKLSYPSSLTLLGKERDSLIHIKRNAIVEGLVLIPGYNQYTLSPGVFKVDKGAIFHGMAYINGAANIEGSLWGHITLRYFQCSEGEAVSANCLIDGEISAVKRSAHLPASLLWANSKKYVVAKWLN